MTAIETAPTLVEMMKRGGHPDFALSDIPQDASFNTWLRYWYGATDGAHGRKARMLAYTDAEPEALAEVLLFRPWQVATDPAEYLPLREAFVELMARWVSDPTMGDEA